MGRVELSAILALQPLWKRSYTISEDQVKAYQKIYDLLKNEETEIYSDSRTLTDEEKKQLAALFHSDKFIAISKILKANKMSGVEEDRLKTITQKSRILLQNRKCYL